MSKPVAVTSAVIRFSTVKGKYIFKVNGEDFPFYLAESDGLKMETGPGYTIIHLPLLILGDVRIVDIDSAE